jgi:hypothetical protein
MKIRPHNVTFSVMLPGKKPVRRTLRSMPGQAWTPADMARLLLQETARVAHYFPGMRFRTVPLADGNFNFVEAAKIESTTESQSHGGSPCQS